MKKVPLLIYKTSSLVHLLKYECENYKNSIKTSKNGCTLSCVHKIRLGIFIVFPCTNTSNMFGKQSNTTTVECVYRLCAYQSLDKLT